ncbi:diacylglycerol kinase [Streptomyces sp. V2]|uniref:Diacylglycerol/lipid kinase family protein n=1 Tax=Streptomyces niveiscabiei TaxID=164115 RepID=A0ABW9HMT4_9ACTN|nr:MULTISPECIES: diacylglycerol kinase family protein [Streptomyces]PWG09763.1 diacylglycerol kinase [Streptomyces sp. V2]QZZ25883.1 diacylglycerol kinase [Streptomyces sp. ST1015]
MNDTRARKSAFARDLDARRARDWARLALLLAACAVFTVVAGAGSDGWLVLLSGVAGLSLAGAGLWWALAHRGWTRLLGALLAVLVPIGVLVLYASSGLWVVAVCAIALWTAALASARSALRSVRQPHAKRRRRGRKTPPPSRPVFIMNPRSGGGKVERFDLVRRAEALGARVILIAPDGTTDPEAEARRALAEGADLLGVAGGDGTQALVAAVAAEHDVPFLVIAAGTRNHFAMDLGLDRTDPVTSLEALTDGVEFRVDLGDVDGRAFVNTVSFGAYAEIVQSPEYRDAKAFTALDLLPDLLMGEAGATLGVHAGSTRLHAPQAVLVSNNPYARADPFGGGRRPRLDSGNLGVIGIKVEGAAQAAEVVLRGERAGGITSTKSSRVEVSADRSHIPVAIDGEALVMPVPVVCTLRQGALRVRVPRRRPGATYSPPNVDWRRIVRLALDRPQADAGEGDD